MISVRRIPKSVKKFCSHCDRPAEFEINFCNEKVVQQSSAGCLCGICMDLLKLEINKEQDYKPVEPVEQEKFNLFTLKDVLIEKQLSKNECFYVRKRVKKPYVMTIKDKDSNFRIFSDDSYLVCPEFISIPNSDSLIPKENILFLEMVGRLLIERGSINGSIFYYDDLSLSIDIARSCLVEKGIQPCTILLKRDLGSKVLQREGINYFLMDYSGLVDFIVLGPPQTVGVFSVSKEGIAMFINSLSIAIGISRGITVYG